jgi:glutamyl-tRNA synthetase
MPDVPEPFVDQVYGLTDLSVRDDFVVQRADGLFAYQLAVVVDDAAMAITDVVRGADLLSSTPRQLALYRALGLPPPQFTHVPLVLGMDGRRLAKRHGSVAIAELRARGVTAKQLIGGLAASLGICPPGSQLSASELLAHADLSQLPQAPTRLDPSVLF